MKNWVQYILISHFTHGIFNVPCNRSVYMELPFLQSEWELHWPGWSLDAINCAWIWPTPHLLICYKFIWRCDHLQTQGSTEQGSEPQCRPFCHATFSHCFHVLNYVNCLCHLNYWNMETHVSTNYSTVTSCLKYPMNIYNISVQELVIRYFCEKDVHFHSSPVVRFYLSFWMCYKPIVITIFVCTVSALPV